MRWKKRKPKLRRTAGGQRRTHSNRAQAQRERWEAEFARRPYAAVANRRLRFRDINRELGDQPPSVVYSAGYRAYLFKSGEDRDRFVEEFHYEFEARAIPQQEVRYGPQAQNR